MNETIKTILSRRSVRRFGNDAVSLPIIDAALHAPGAMNQQPWDFTVITSLEKINALGEASNMAINKNGDAINADIFYKAPVVVVVSMQKGELLPMADCGTAVKNMLLAAHSLGIGSCSIDGTIPYFTSANCNGEFGIPETHSPYFAVALGCADGERKNGVVRYMQ